MNSRKIALLLVLTMLLGSLLSGCGVKYEESTLNEAPENDINDFAFFNEYLQPTETVITYATVIRFLGNAELVKNISNEKDLVIDEYTKNGKKIEVYYSLGDKTRISAPEGEYKAYDMYGNPIEIGGKITVTNSPVYIVY